jgi:hypothetical protein
MTDIIERFWSRVDKKGADECWPWLGKPLSHGYGSMRINNKQTRVHRVSYEINRGDIPKGLLVCHRCDNRICVNPNHLFLGTYTDNNRDRQNKGRTALPALKGDFCPASKLKEAQIIYIRSSSKSSKDLAKEIGIAYSTIRQIRNRGSWKHI